MFLRVLAFCLFVCLILFTVLSYIHGRPAIHLFFQRCCEENIENDQVIFENFGTNFLRERLIGNDLIVEDNVTSVNEDAISGEIDRYNVHDPADRTKAEGKESFEVEIDKNGKKEHLEVEVENEDGERELLEIEVQFSEQNVNNSEEIGSTGDDSDRTEVTTKRSVPIKLKML